MNRPINIMYLVANADPYGSNRSLLNLLSQLISNKVRPIVILNKEGALCNKLKEIGATYFRIKYYYSIYPRLNNVRDCVLFPIILTRTLIYNFIAIRKLEEIATRNKVDIIHTNIGLLQIGHIVAKRLKIPHIWHIREYQDLYMGYQPLFSNKSFIRKLRYNNNFPIAITIGLYEHYRMKNNATIIYNGIRKADKAQFISEKEKYFLFVGRLDKGKGIKNVIEAFIEFAKFDSEYNLIIAGDGKDSYKSQLQSIVDNEGINDRIIFGGFRDDVDILMSKATALIISSSNEGFGNTTAEAMFNGCLVIGKNSGGTKEILENESMGVLYNTDHDLTSTIMFVKNQGIDKFFPRIIKAQEKAIKKYSCESNAESIFNLYLNVLVH